MIAVADLPGGKAARTGLRSQKIRKGRFPSIETPELEPSFALSIIFSSQPESDEPGPKVMMLAGKRAEGNVSL
ncbi:MAG: hypothetical protein H5U05_10555 [Candidatus Aminicenantes bacterium]|nr:hypothetical protein [Candidatus Aminicenantes bacterium]